VSEASTLDAGEHRLTLSGPTMPADAALSWRKPWTPDGRAGGRLHGAGGVEPT